MIYLKYFFLVASLSFMSGNCKNKGASDSHTLGKTHSDQEKVLIYRAAAYKDPDHKTWLATLNKGETVQILETLPDPVKLSGKNETIVKVKLSDDSVGYIRERYLAKDAIAITEDSVPIFSRNNRTSGQKGNLPLGTVAFLMEEKGEWIQITGGELPDGTVIYNSWLDSGFTKDENLVVDAILIEQSRNILKGKAKGDKKNATSILENIAGKGHKFSGLAGTLLGDRGGYEYPDNAILAQVTASSIPLREEPNINNQGLTILPAGEIVQILQTEEEQIEVDGMTGKWNYINFEGTKGYIFDVYLEKL